MVDEEALKAIALDVVTKLAPAGSDPQLAGAGWRWHQAFARMKHRIGLHDYLPTYVYDMERGVVEPVRVQCWICHDVQ